MADQHPEPLETMAFQLILQKLLSLEQAMQALPPLLAKIVAQLEAQHTPPPIEVATYAQLYPDEVTEEDGVIPPDPFLAQPRPPARSRRGWRQFFLRAEAP